MGVYPLYIVSPYPRSRSGLHILILLLKTNSRIESNLILTEYFKSGQDLPAPQKSDRTLKIFNNSTIGNRMSQKHKKKCLPPTFYNIWQPWTQIWFDTFLFLLFFYLGKLSWINIIFQMCCEKACQSPKHWTESPAVREREIRNQIPSMPNLLGVDFSGVSRQGSSFLLSYSGESGYCHPLIFRTRFTIGRMQCIIKMWGFGHLGGSVG